VVLGLVGLVEVVEVEDGAHVEEHEEEEDGEGEERHFTLGIGEEVEEEATQGHHPFRMHPEALERTGVVAVLATQKKESMR
jgi:hypothetical protein